MQRKPIFGATAALACAALVLGAPIASAERDSGGGYDDGGSYGGDDLEAIGLTRTRGWSASTSTTPAGPAPSGRSAAAG